jgi:acyl-CoA hydrolase
VFGPVIAEGMDVAAAQYVDRRLNNTILTKDLRVEFLKPGLLRDRLSYYIDDVKVGRTSATVTLTCEADRLMPDGSYIKVVIAKGVVTMVNVGPDGKSAPWPVRNDQAGGEAAP